MAAGWSELSGLVSEARDAIVGLRFDGTIASWNLGARELFGYPAHEVVGQPFSILTVDGSRDVEAVVALVRDGSAVSNYVDALRSKSGKITSVSITVSAVRSTTADPIGLAQLIRPIGPTSGEILKPEIAAAADASMQFLALRSQRRTALTEELRQPLTAIIAYLEAIKSGRVSAANGLQTAVGRAYEQASRAGKIMHLLSECEPYESDKDEVVRLASLLASVGLAVARSADQAGVTIVYWPADDAEICVDFQVTQQALNFLLLEAIEAASRKPKSRVTVSVRRDANHICLSITTAPFDQSNGAKSSPTHEDKGVLSHRIALCRVVLLQQGGELQWSNVCGTGVAFHCIFPIVVRNRS